MQGRYTIAAASDPRSLLAQHETAVFDEYRKIVQTHGHRSKVYASTVLPHSASLVESIGARMAYDAAIAEGVPTPLVDLYVFQCIKDNLAWYVGAGLLDRESFARMEDSAFERAFPHMDSYVKEMRVDAFAQAPIVSDAKWTHFIRTLDSFETPETGLEKARVDDTPPIRHRLMSLGKQVLLASLRPAIPMTPLTI